MNILTLLTDFGTEDSYVAAMKGIILSVSQNIRILDITHEIASFDIDSASWILYNSYYTFPVGTVHVCVVDPGVGTLRDIIVIKAFGYWFVGPDNGVFSMILQKPYPLDQSIFKTPFFENSSFIKSHHTDEPNVFENPVIWKMKKELIEPLVSKTFHARDIFAPLGAALCCQDKRKKLLSEYFIPFASDPKCLDSIKYSNLFTKKAVNLSLIRDKCFSNKGFYAISRAVHIDAFGNIICDIVADVSCREIACLCVKHGNQTYEIPFKHTYQEVSRFDLLVYKGSTGLLEIAVNKGSAANKMNLERGDVFEIRIQ